MINQDDSIIKEETVPRKPQIMVVDDEEYILEPIKIALEHNRCPSVDTAVECMKLGTVDYIAKPFDMEYFNIVVEKTLYKRELEKRASEREYYEHISRIDGLTGAYNHSFFITCLVVKFQELSGTNIVFRY